MAKYSSTRQPSIETQEEAIKIARSTQQPGQTKVKWGGFIEDADCFDARFFGISPVEAESMDPQFRIFLETVWATLEDAGYPASALSGSKTGVFAGVATSDYKDLWVEAKLKGTVKSSAEPFPFMVTNRVSYWFNFHGPSEVIDTACSSSLIAINRAIESIRQGNCDLALAGGVNVIGRTAYKYPPIGSEQVIACNPDVIIEPAMTGGDIAKQLDAATAYWKRFSNISAVLNKRIYVIDGDTVSQLGPRIYDGVETIGRCLRPELY